MTETARLERRKVEELGGRCALQRRKDFPACAAGRAWCTVRSGDRSGLAFYAYRQAVLRGGAK